jgi:hypothetical protein
MTLVDYTILLSAAGTVLSAAIASATYVNATIQRRRDEVQQRSAQIRETIKEVVKAIKFVVRELNEGTVLVFAASTVAQDLLSRLSDKPDSNELRELISNSPLMLSVAISGWHNNISAREFDKAIYGLRQTGDALTGVFRIYGEILDLLIDLVRDGYSWAIFKRILDNLGQEKVDIVGWEKPYYGVLNEVTVRLQSDAAEHFVFSYTDAIKEIDCLVKYMSLCVQNFDDRKVVKLASIRLTDEVNSATRTGSMRSWLQILSPHISNEQTNKLLMLIKNLETYITKEHAGRKLEEMQTIQARTQPHTQ